MEIKKIQIGDSESKTIVINGAVCSYEISVGKNSSLTVYDIHLETCDTDRNLNINLEGEDSSSGVFGLYVLKGNTKSKSKIVVNHMAKNCKSEQIYRTILDDKSRGNFEGKIYVAKNATGTVAHQESKNLLLSDTATISTIPSLEIYTDDVKCSHGAASGVIDPEALFYMKARGINADKAKELLTFAFAKTVIDQIHPPELKAEIEKKVKQKLEKSCMHIYS